MNYITVRQAAQAWNISERRVQKYGTQGRLPGARKFGNAWQIPGSAPKPADGRTAAPGRTPVPRTGKPDGRAALLPLMNTAFAPGRCRAVLDAMPEGPNRDIATAEYLYFSGQAEAAARAAERYLHARSRETRLSANLLYAYANLSVGRIQQVRCALGEVQRTLTADRDPQRGAAALFVAATASVLLHLPLPDGMPPPAGSCLCCRRGCGPLPCMCRPTTCICRKSMKKAPMWWKPPWPWAPRNIPSRPSISTWWR